MSHLIAAERISMTRWAVLDAAARGTITRLPLAIDISDAKVSLDRTMDFDGQSLKEAAKLIEEMFNDALEIQIEAERDGVVEVAPLGLGVRIRLSKVVVKVGLSYGEIYRRAMSARGALFCF